MKPDYSKAIVCTATGGYIDLLNPDPQDIRLEDIAKALSKLCRFTGHTSRFYSVAEHSVRVAQYLRRGGHTPATQLAGLLHDASEAYLGDVGTPLKRIMPQYRDLEEYMELCVQERFNVVFRDRADIKHADLVLLAYEKSVLLPHEPNPWPLIEHIDPDEYENAKEAYFKRKSAASGKEIKLYRSTLGWNPDVAENLFRRAFNAITREDLTGYWTFDKLKEVM